VTAPDPDLRHPLANPSGAGYPILGCIPAGYAGRKPDAPARMRVVKAESVDHRE
jgi:hypothetical protein